MHEVPRITTDLADATASIATAATTTAATALGQFKVSLRRYSPVQKGLAGLPWEGEWLCGRCGETTRGRLFQEPAGGRIALEHDCSRCGTWREPHADVLFTAPRGAAHPRQPRETFSGSPIRPIPRALPRTVETLCPECACLILGRSYERDGAVWMEKTCPEHGYFRDKITSDARLWLLCEERCFQDERGVEAHQTREAVACPTDCGLCARHMSTTCLGQVDLSNRCNLTCPVCFASANQAGYLAEPCFEGVVDVHEDFFPASLVTPVSRFLQVLEGKPKIRLSCHADCGIGTYFFVTPEGDTVPIPRMFDLMRLFGGLNDLAAEIEGRGADARPTRFDLVRAGWLFLRSYRWRNMRRSITPLGFVRALRSMTDKAYGRGEGASKAYRTIMTGGMHFMDRYNYDTERVRRCVIQYSTPDGLYPFCTINSGPTYRPYIEALHARPLA